MNAEFLKNKFRKVVLLDLIIIILSIIIDSLLFGYSLYTVIKVDNSSVSLYGEIVSLFVSIIALVYFLVVAFKYKKIKDEEIIDFGIKNETTIGRFGVYLMILSIYTFSFSLIKAFSLVSNYNLYTLIFALVLVVPGVLSMVSSIMTLKLSASFYALKEKKNA